MADRRGLVKARVRHVVSYSVRMDSEAENRRVERGPVAVFELEGSRTETTAHEIVCPACGRTVVVEVGPTGGWRRRRRRAWAAALALGAACAAALGAVQAADTVSASRGFGCAGVVLLLAALYSVIRTRSERGLAITPEPGTPGPPGELPEAAQFHTLA
ncbi:hypothetical protein [Glycomyces paridis]|uniref:Uncharacterized protein n=1 Tax=Glycomyces paridis TaxID=2126555 RepID=A0A4S8PPG6_9ACTN|nr:hypothetical protein [Glycomyces paridis]THV30214.1 hypothetical protein E9998_07535 [Glycomyces paridis]